MAKSHKGPSVDPQHGDLRAEPGSREWALGVRASLWGKERDLGAGVKDVAIRLDRLLVTDGWKHLFRADGTPFESFEEYLTYRAPYGMGVPLDLMRHYLSLTHEGRAVRERLAVKGHPTHRVPLASLRADGGTQVREKTDAETVERYAAAITEGAAFPPVVVFFDGEVHWLADGFHRVAAHEAAGVADVLAEVREGTKRDALFYALSANKRHGRPMSNADKRKAILIMLKDEEWGISDRYIADKLGVSPTTVGAVRKEEGCSTVQVGQLSTPKTKGADGKSRHKPGEAESKVRDFFDQNPGMVRHDTSDRGLGLLIDVSPAVVAKVRKELAGAPVGDEAPASEPSPPARHPVLAEIDDAKDAAALDRAFNRVAMAGFSAAESAEASAAYQRRSAELRAAPPSPAPTVPAPPPAQASLLADDDADDLRAEASRWLKRLATSLPGLDAARLRQLNALLEKGAAL